MSEEDALKLYVEAGMQSVLTGGGHCDPPTSWRLVPDEIVDMEPPFPLISLQNRIDSYHEGRRLALKLTQE